MKERREEIASAMPADLDALPKLRGFRLRGLEMTRLETFIDAAFAFAITLLVIASGQVPENAEALLAAFKNVPAFVASIATLGIFWRGHWLWSRRYGLEDGPSILVSWGMIVTVLIYVYPLRLLFSGLFYYLSGHRLGHTMSLQTETQARAIFAIYGAGFVLLSLEVLLLNVRAWQLREPLQFNAQEEKITRAEISGWSIPIFVGLLSLILSLTLPISLLSWSGWVYLVLAILVPLHRRRRRRESD